MGLRNFRIDAGGGNLAFAGNFYGDIWPELQARHVKGDIVFLSRSNSKQGDRQHIIDPSKPKRLLKSKDEVYCCYSYSEKRDWVEESAIADAFSKAQIINPNVGQLPQTCQSWVSQNLN